MNTVRRRIVTAAAAAVILSGLAACGSDDTEPETEPTTATSEPADDEDEDAADAGTPAWANPATTEGDKIATIEVGDVTVDVYQVGTAEATKTGNFVDPDTNEPLVAVGDELVFVNYVVTNNGDPIDLGSSLVSVDARYDDWPYLQGMDGLSDRDLFEQLGLFSGGLADGGFNEEGIYTLGSGESFSFAENFAHQPGSEIEFKVRYTPVDAEGDLLHDDRVEASGTGTIE